MVGRKDQDINRLRDVDKFHDIGFKTATALYQSCNFTTRDLRNKIRKDKVVALLINTRISNIDNILDKKKRQNNNRSKKRTSTAYSSINTTLID
jgi:hypothetical protein